MNLRLNFQEAKGISMLFYSIGNESRLLILESIAHGLKPKDITNKLQIPRSTVQSHLNILCDRGLVVGKRDNYRLTPLGVSMLNWTLEKFKPHSSEYLRMVSIGEDLRRLQTFPEPLVSKLSIETEGENVRGLEIIKELDKNWITLMNKIKKVFE